MSKRIYLNLPDRGASGYYRARLPHRHCAAPLADDGIELVCSEQLDTRDEYDAYVFHRIIHPNFMPVVEHLKKQGKRIVLELDDDFWHIADDNPAAKSIRQPELATLEWTLDLADQIWVSTDPLAEVVWRGDKVKVLPNLIDPADYPAAVRHDDGRVRILWAGSVHHDADLDVLVPVVEEITRRYGDKVQFLFFGYWPVGLCDWVRIRFTNLAVSVPRKDLKDTLAFVDPVDLGDYPATLAGLSADIGLAPLADYKFNHSKSGIKFFEYTVAGAVAVATDLPPYAQAHCRVRPDGGPDAWVRMLSVLIEDERSRASMYRASRDTVLGKHSWTSPARNTWLDAFRGVA